FFDHRRLSRSARSASIFSRSVLVLQRFILANPQSDYDLAHLQSNWRLPNSSDRANVAGYMRAIALALIESSPGLTGIINSTGEDCDDEFPARMPPGAGGYTWVADRRHNRLGRGNHLESQWIDHAMGRGGAGALGVLSRSETRHAGCRRATGNAPVSRPPS